MSNEKLEQLIDKYQEAESRFNIAEDMLDKPHLDDENKTYASIRKAAHDEMIKLGHQIMTEENKINQEASKPNRDYFGDKQKAEQEQDARLEKKMAETDAELAKEEKVKENAQQKKEAIVESDLSWEEKKRLFAELHVEEKATNKEQDMAKEEDELEL